MSSPSRTHGPGIFNGNQRLMNGIRGAAGRHGPRLLVARFGAALALHFSAVAELHDCRDTRLDDRALLSRFLLAANAEGVNILPDGRMYISTAHSEQDIEEAVAALERTFAALGEPTCYQTEYGLPCCCPS